MSNNCKYCLSGNIVFHKTPDLPHYGKYICGNCKRFNNWVPTPNSKNSNSLRSNSKDVKDVCDFHLFNDQFCFFCLRERVELGAKETLTIDHIKELNKGGEDQVYNMQVLCSACHKLKNWTRLYMNWHFKEKVIQNDLYDV